MHHDHPKQCAVPKMNLDRILLRVIFLELQVVRLDTIRSWTSVVVVDRLEEIRALESQVMYGVKKRRHQELEEPNKQNISVNYCSLVLLMIITDADNRRRLASVAACRLSPGCRIGGMNRAI